jgi:hypothetical protein
MVKHHVSECRQTPFSKSYLKKKGLFLFLRGIFSCFFKKRTPYIDELVIIKNGYRLCRQPEISLLDDLFACYLIKASYS